MCKKNCKKKKKKTVKKVEECIRFLHYWETYERERLREDT